MFLIGHFAGHHILHEFLHRNGKYYTEVTQELKITNENKTVFFVTSLYYFPGMGLLLDAAFYQMLRTSLLFFCVILRLIFLKKVIFYIFSYFNICITQHPKWYECVGVSLVILGIIIEASKTLVENS